MEPEEKENISRSVVIFVLSISTFETWLSVKVARVDGESGKLARASRILLRRVVCARRGSLNKERACVGFSPLYLRLQLMSTFCVIGDSRRKSPINTKCEQGVSPVLNALLLVFRMVTTHGLVKFLPAVSLLFCLVLPGSFLSMFCIFSGPVHTEIDG